MNEKTSTAPIGIENAYEVMEEIKKNAKLDKQTPPSAKANTASKKPATAAALPPTVTPVPET